MYYVNKIVGWVMSPLGILFIGLAAAWAVHVVQGRRRKGPGWAAKLIAGAVLAFTWFMGSGVAIRLVGVPLEVDEADLAALPESDAIVLLGGGMGVHEKCGRAEIFAGADRVWAAARLYRDGKAPVVFVTGPNNLAASSGLLADLGVPTNALRSVDGARNTEEEARGIRSLMTGRRPRILLVTSAWHMKRAKLMFEKFAPGVEVVAAPTDFEMRGVTEGAIRFGDFLPGADALLRNTYALKEWIARIGYAVLR